MFVAGCKGREEARIGMRRIYIGKNSMGLKEGRIG